MSRILDKERKYKMHLLFGQFTQKITDGIIMNKGEVYFWTEARLN
jgi:hypothetical protein